MKTSPSSHSDDASWSHYPVRDKIVVITGASSGVGFETSKQLAGQGGEIVMIVRDARTAPEAARLGSAQKFPLPCRSAGRPFDASVSTNQAEADRGADADRQTWGRA